MVLDPNNKGIIQLVNKSIMEVEEEEIISDLKDHLQRIPNHRAGLLSG